MDAKTAFTREASKQGCLTAHNHILRMCPALKSLTKPLCCPLNYTPWPCQGSMPCINNRLLQIPNCLSIRNLQCQESWDVKASGSVLLHCSHLTCKIAHVSPYIRKIIQTCFMIKSYTKSKIHYKARNKQNIRKCPPYLERSAPKESL